MLIDKKKRKKISHYKLLRFYFKIRGLLIFVCFYYIPIIFTSLIISFFNFFNQKINSNLLSKIISDNLFIYSIYFIMIFVLFLLLKKYNNKAIDFFSEENWFVSMGKAFIPAILAFGSGFFVTFLVIKIFNILPEIKFIKNWLKVPNEGFIILLDYIKGMNAFKIIIWFFFIIVIVPLFEEIYFRGFLQDFIQKVFKKYNLDIIITAFIFSLFHIFSLSNVIFAFIVGLFLSHQRKINKSINISIWIHCLINFTGLCSGIIFHYINNKFN
jgi:membrane protease YdiL (CAAX protease family)